MCICFFLQCILENCKALHKVVFKDKTLFACVGSWPGTVIRDWAYKGETGIPKDSIIIIITTTTTITIIITQCSHARSHAYECTYERSHAHSHAFECTSEREMLNIPAVCCVDNHRIGRSLVMSICPFLSNLSPYVLRGNRKESERER